MNYQQFGLANMILGEAIDKIRDAGIKVDRRDGTSVVKILNACRAQCMQGETGFLDTRDRAFDAAPHNDRVRGFDIRRPALVPNPADDSADDDRDGDLRQVCNSLKRLIDTGDGNSEVRQFAERLIAAINGFLNRSNDADRFRGKAMKDMEADGRKPWDAYEPDASRAGRERLRQDRALAARAADSRPRGFLGEPAIADSDLGNLERQAMETFGI